MNLATGLVPLILVLLATGCFRGEEPLPPHEALARAAQRIDRVLAEERAHGHAPAPTEPSQTPGDPACVTLWHCSHPLLSRSLLDRELMAAFSAAHPSVKFEHQFIGDWYVAVQKLTVSLAAGDVPDLALIKRPWLAHLAGSGRLAPLDGLLPPALLDDIREAPRRALSVRGILYALPADGFCSVLFYNKDLAGANPPATWEDLRRVAHEATRIEDAVYGVGDLPFVEALWSAGGRVSDELASGLDTVEARETLDFILGLRREGLAHPRALGQPQRAFELFLAGQVAMTVADSHCVARLSTASFPSGVAPVPGKKGPVSRLSDSAIVVFAKYAQAKRTAIASVLDFVTGPRLLGKEAAVLGSAPIRASVAEDLSAIMGLDEAYAHARNTPLIPAWGAVEFELMRNLSLAYRWQPPG